MDNEVSRGLELLKTATRAWRLAGDRWHGRLLRDAGRML